MRDVNDILASPLSSPPREVESVRQSEPSPQEFVCDCAVCESVRLSGLKDVELLHYLMNNNAADLREARIGKATAEADVEYWETRRSMTELLINAHKATVERTPSTEDGGPDEAKP